MTETDAHSTRPKSIRQKQILTIAEENPTATLAEIAADISGVSADHVDRVLTQYGDPGTHTTSTPPSGSPQASDSTPPQPSSDTATTDDDTEPVSQGDSDDELSEADTEPASPPTDMPTPDPPPSTVPPSEPPLSSESPPSESTSTADPTPSASTSSSATAPTDETTPSQPAAPTAQSTASPATGSSTDGGQSTRPADQYPDPGSLTQKEHETLRAIAHDTDATQQDVADMLGVSRATVSNRVNALSGFDWADRASFVEAVIGERDDPTPETETAAADNTPTPADDATADSEMATGTDDTETPADEGADGDPTTVADTSDPPTMAADPAHDDLQTVTETLEALKTQVEAIEDAVDDTNESSSPQPLADSELLHKIVHACMESDRIAEDEEIAILDALLN